jgi:hypothetical protein
MRDSYYQRRARHTGRESEATLDHMLGFFGDDGANWTPDVYSDAEGRRCLVGAANHVRVSSLDDAKVYLRQAIAEHEGRPMAIEAFNDSRSSYGEIALIIERAKELARAAQLPAPVFHQALPASVAAPVATRALPAPAFRQPPLTVEATPLQRSVLARRRSLAEFLRDD